MYLNICFISIKPFNSFQLDAKNKKEELSAYFKRLKAILERRETDLKLELETRENKAMEDCKRQTDLLQASEKRLNSAIGQTRQLLTEERLQMLNVRNSHLRFCYKPSVYI